MFCPHGLANPEACPLCSHDARERAALANRAGAAVAEIDNLSCDVEETESLEPSRKASAIKTLSEALHAIERAKVEIEGA